MVSGKMASGKSFCEEMLLKIWRDLHFVEPDEYPSDFRGNIHVLMRVSRLTSEQMAERLGMNASNLRAVQMNGKPVKPEMCERLSGIARDMHLPVLASWFEMERGLAIYRRGRKKDAGPRY